MIFNPDYTLRAENLNSVEITKWITDIMQKQSFAQLSIWSQSTSSKIENAINSLPNYLIEYYDIIDDGYDCEDGSKEIQIYVSNENNLLDNE